MGAHDAQQRIYRQSPTCKENRGTLSQHFSDMSFRREESMRHHNDQITIAMQLLMLGDSRVPL